MAECTIPDDEAEEVKTYLSDSSGKKEELFSDEENKFFSAFENYFTDDGSEETSSSEYSSDDDEDCVQLSDSIRMFPNKRISTHGEIYEGELRSGILDARPIVLKLVENIPQSITEARILAKLNNHSHVLSLIQAGTFNFRLVDQIYIALDKCHHENLREFVTNRNNQGFAFNLSLAIEIAGQMVDGVKYIHENRIIHKDLKPDNILFSLDQRLIKIADFGVSQEIDSTSAEIFVEGQFGTNGFRPPESFGKGIISQKSDIFSLGVTFYFVLSNGEHPFGEDSDGWNYHVKNGIVDLSGLLVPHIKRTGHLIKSMIEHKINDRPTVWQVSEHPFWTGNEGPCDFDYHCPGSSSSLIPPTPEEPSISIGDLHLLLEHIERIELRDEAAAAKSRQRDKSDGEGSSSGIKHDMTKQVGKVQVKFSTEEAYHAHLHDDTIYRIDPNRCKGRVLIITDPETREKQEIETTKMFDFWRMLGFDVKVEDCCTFMTVAHVDICQKFLAETKDVSVVVVIIMPCLVIKLNFLRLFHPDKCPHLRDVPKVLFYQEYDFFSEDLYYDADYSYTPSTTQKLFHILNGDPTLQVPDMVLICSSVFLDLFPTEETLFIVRLINFVMKHVHDMHFKAILQVYDMYDDGICHSTLRKKLYLFPGWPI